MDTRSAFDIPKRTGDGPKTTNSMPHSQLDQNTSKEMVDKLAEWAFSLKAVEEHPSAISLPGARALWLRHGYDIADRAALIIKREFAHIHPLPDGSMHMMLPENIAKRVIESGWGEYHPLVHSGNAPPTLLMVFGPRNDEELETLKKIVRESYRFASGLDQ